MRRALPGRVAVSHTVPVTDSGFADEAPGRPARARSRAAGRAGDTTARRSRRPSAALIAFLLLVLGLVGFAGWAWSSRLHADDLAAYTALAGEIEVLDRSLTPLGHSAIPPCRDSADGRVTRTYPASTGPQAAELVGYLTQKGWTRGQAAPPALAHLTRTESEHLLTIDVVARSESSLVESLVAHSPASAFGCLGR